jgi:hypothetical protein
MGVSMEEFGRNVSVDYYNGRRVEEVTEGPGGEGAPVWTIHLADGAVINNYDPTLDMPKTIKGAALTMVILNGGGVSGKPMTELRFGLEVVYLNPLEYTISDPTYTKGVEVYAQRSHANMPRTAPHPDERIQDGPEQQPDDEAEEPEGA